MKALLVFVALLFVYAHANICSNPSAYAGRSLCDHNGGYCGECVSFYKICTGDRRTTGQWVRGQKVRGANLPIGTGIATFPNGKYYGHAAIYMGQNAQGIQVWDQWRGHPVSTRTIRWNGNGISNNGDSFYVIAGGSGGSSPAAPSPRPSPSPSPSGGGNFGSCTANGMSGRCINTNSERCSGTLHTGRCPGASNIRCCTGGSNAVGDSASTFSDSTPAVGSVAATVVISIVGAIIVILLVVVVVVLSKKLNASSRV